MCESLKKPSWLKALVMAAALFFGLMAAGLGLMAAPARALEADPAAQNPRPDPLDISFPLPCGLSMAFRTVAVPTAALGLLSDAGLSVGGGGDYSESLVSRPHSSYIGSSLTPNELPEEFRPAALESLSGQPAAQLFLIGKYEVTAAQWAAVMEGCDAKVAGGAKPKTSVSWFEAVKFTETLMRWLIANSPGSLPRFSANSKDVGIVRLPTESEWEYAARGGHLASPGSLESDTLLLAPGASVEEYGATGPDLAPIGSRKPNALGVYDTVGNAAEMTMETFRMTVAKRLHGAHGGVTVKGGSHVDDASGLRPGRRQELPFFDSGGAAKAPNVGFRLVVSALNLPGERTKELESEYGAKFGFDDGDDAATAIIPEDDWGVEGAATGALTANEDAQAESPSRLIDTGPTDRIRALIKDVSEPTHKEALTKLLVDVENAALAREERTLAEVTEKCVSILYAAWGIRDTSLRQALVIRRLQHLEKTVQEIPAQMRMNISAEEKSQLAQTLEQAKAGQAPLQAELPQYEHSLSQQFSYYKNLLLDLNDYDRPMVVTAVEAVARGLQGDDPLTVSKKRAMGFVIADVGKVLSGRNDQILLNPLMVEIK